MTVQGNSPQGAQRAQRKSDIRAIHRIAPTDWDVVASDRTGSPLQIGMWWRAIAQDRPYEIGMWWRATHRIVATDWDVVAGDLIGRPYNIWEMRVGIHRAAETMSLRAAVSSVVCGLATMTPLKPRQRVKVLSSMSSPRET